MTMTPNTCAGCKYAYTVSWYGGTSSKLENYCQTRCDLKHREIRIGDKDCEFKEVRNKNEKY